MSLEIHSTKEAVVINVMVLVFHPICTSAAIASRRAVIFPRPNPPVGPSASLPDTLGVRNPRCCGQKQIHTHESGVLRGKGNFKVESSPRLGRARPLARLIIRSPFNPSLFFCRWLHEIEQNCEVVTRLLVGNKNDDPDRKVVLTEDARRFADQMGIQE